MPTPDVDVARMIGVLANHSVRFVVIGGFAIELHDVPVPPTRDVDITPSGDDGNLARLVEALNELGVRLRVAGGPPGGMDIPGGLTVEWLKAMVSMAFITAAGPLDISFIPDGTTGYHDLARNQVLILFGDHELSVASLRDVIRSKEAAGREKDLIILPALREHLRRTGR